MNATGSVTFESLEFEKRGTIDSWLSSGVFAIPQPGSTERETAIQDAVRLQNQQDPAKADIEAVTARLREHLAAEDRFWVRWIFFGVLP
jgi:hypothetical protein